MCVPPKKLAVVILGTGLPTAAGFTRVMLTVVLLHHHIQTSLDRDCDVVCVCVCCIALVCVHVSSLAYVSAI